LPTALILHQHDHVLIHRNVAQGTHHQVVLAEVVEGEQGNAFGDAALAGGGIAPEGAARWPGTARRIRLVRATTPETPP
jgi:hypothetical protein